jgi:predicted nucleic acid-binding protein
VTTYVDSSALVAVYVPEQFSKAARRTVRAVPQVPFTQLHELEVANAFELLAGRGLISRDEYRAIHAQLQDDVESQRLARVTLNL